MSSTVETTTTPAEVKSSFSENSTPSKITTLTRKYTQKPKKELIYHYEYPPLKKQHDEHGLKLEQSMQDIATTNFLMLTLPETRRSVVTTVVREEALDRLGVAGPKNKKAQFLIWYSQESGRDNKGVERTDFISHGIDKQATVIQKFDEDGEELQPELSIPYTVYTIPWTNDKFEEILKDQDLEDRDRPIQFSVTAPAGSNSSWGGFTKEEMILPLEELIERGKIGRAGSDTSVMFSSLSTKDKLFLHKEARK